MLFCLMDGAMEIIFLFISFPVCKSKNILVSCFWFIKIVFLARKERSCVSPLLDFIAV